MKRAKHLLFLAERKLVSDVFLTAEEVVQKRKKQLSHLRFARPTKHGWSFFKKKQAQCELLDEITHTVSALHPNYEKGTIAHVLSEMVNLTKRDILHLQAMLL